MGWPIHRQNRPSVRSLSIRVLNAADHDGPRHRMHAFNQSLSYDRRMHKADIRGSISYAKALEKVGILTSDERQKLVAGLEQVGQEWADGKVCDSLTLGRRPLLI